jgi:hypothetical protein
MIMLWTAIDTEQSKVPDKAGAAGKAGRAGK